MDLDVWACPVCLSRLEETPEGLRCTPEGRGFGRRGYLPVLLRAEDEALLQDADRYAAAWRREAWTPTPEELVGLPYIGRSQWKQKARSLEALLSILGPPNGRTVADVGAGTGWLSHRLTEAGFRCFATDVSSDSAVGLGAAKAFDGRRRGVERGGAGGRGGPPGRAVRRHERPRPPRCAECGARGGGLPAAFEGARRLGRAP